MMRHDLPGDKWQKSSYSPDNGGQCIETQMTNDDLVAIGDSKNRDLGAHTFGLVQWQEFVTAVRNAAL
jgi:hypothetical protein